MAMASLHTFWFRACVRRFRSLSVREGELQIPSSLVSPVVLERDGSRFEVRLIGGTGSRTVSGEKATFADALPGVDAVYAARTDGVKETLQLKTAAAAARTELRYSIHADAGRLDGGVRVAEGIGAPSFEKPASTTYRPRAAARDVGGVRQPRFPAIRLAPWVRHHRAMDLRAEIEAVATDPEFDLLDRSIRITSLLSEALAPLRVRPVLVGGMAVLFWTPAYEFTTKDIDLVMDEPPEADDVLRSLGFVQARDGRHWELPRTDVLIELPSRRLPAGAEVTEVVLPDGRTAAVLSQVDVLIVRLEELGVGPHEDVSRQALALIPGADRDRLRARAAQVGIGDLLERFMRFADEVADGTRDRPSAEELYSLVTGD